LPRNGAATRNRILDVAQDLVLNQGYSGTSIENVIGKAGLTKGAFFYHFKSKAAMAEVLIARFAEADRQEFTSLMEKAESMSPDPLHQLLVFVGLHAETMAKLDTVHPGCLYAAYCYESGLLEETHIRVTAGALRFWRERVSGKIKEILKDYRPKVDIDAESLADHLLVTYEGAFILSRTLNEPMVVAQQLLQYRNYLEILFEKR
jgi:TetR/AcrR family transcriptional repressor of nem operon